MVGRIVADTEHIIYRRGDTTREGQQCLHIGCRVTILFLACAALPGPAMSSMSRTTPSGRCFGAALLKQSASFFCLHLSS
eukprot:scaffold299013_cov26-Prasinocladus_malaysianus.AAC.1